MVLPSVIKPSGDKIMTKVFKIDTTKEGITTVTPFETKKDAQAKGNSGHIIVSSEDLTENFALTTSIMRDAYNALNPDKQIARFSDRETACRRLWASLEAMGGGSSPETAAAEGSPEKAAKKAAPERKSGAGKAAKKGKAPNVPKEKKASAGPRKGSRRDKPLELKKGAENPYRVATGNHKSFELAASNPGKTFKELVAKGARPNAIAHLLRLGLLKISG